MDLKDLAANRAQQVSAILAAWGQEDLFLEILFVLQDMAPD